MKFDIDCAREILLTLEAKENDCSMSFTELNNSLPSYSGNPSLVEYTCFKLEEAGFITLELKNNGSGFIERITDITYQGHQFIADIRDKDIWNKVKKKASAVGSFSVKTVSQIAVAVISEMIKNQLISP